MRRQAIVPLGNNGHLHQREQRVSKQPAHNGMALPFVGNAIGFSFSSGVTNFIFSFSKPADNSVHGIQKNLVLPTDFFDFFRAAIRGSPRYRTLAISAPEKNLGVLFWLEESQRPRVFDTIFRGLEVNFKNLTSFSLRSGRSNINFV